MEDKFVDTLSSGGKLWLSSVGYSYPSVICPQWSGRFNPDTSIFRLYYDGWCVDGTITEAHRVVRDAFADGIHIEIPCADWY